MVLGRATDFVSGAKADSEGEEAMELGGSVEEVKKEVQAISSLIPDQKLSITEAFIAYSSNPWNFYLLLVYPLYILDAISEY